MNPSWAVIMFVRFVMIRPTNNNNSLGLNHSLKYLSPVIITTVYDLIYSIEISISFDLELFECYKMHAPIDQILVVPYWWSYFKHTIYPLATFYILNDHVETSKLKKNQRMLP